jgi:aldehyde:ferredoxin oxidoreductase
MCPVVPLWDAETGKEAIMEFRGYAGSGLYVNLSTGTITKEPLDPELVRRFVGGFGFTNKLAYDLIEPGVDPLSPENVVIIGSGALSGTLAPGSAKVMATTKMPINNAIGTSFGGGFSPLLKCAGYDYVVIRGRADRPVYLEIVDDDVNLVSASDVWGKDTFETTDLLRTKHGADCSVITIGQAGENLVRISFALVNKFSSLGRGGLGAVFGSKNLKALVVNGTKGVSIADAERFVEVSDSVRKSMLKYPYRKEWLKLSIALGFMIFAKIMGTGRNWRELLTADRDHPTLLQALLNIFHSGHACPTCPLNCRALVKLKEGEYSGLTVPTSSIDHACAWIDAYEGCDLNRSVKYFDLCNRYGLDEFATRSLIDYAIDLYQGGIITREDADGQELNWDAKSALSLLERICRREGLGDTLADGLIPTAKRFGKLAAERVVTIKGLDPFVDPRAHLTGWELSACVNPRGSYVSPGVTPAFAPGRTQEQIARYCRKLLIPEEAIERICSGSTEFNLARLVKHAEDWYSVYSCLGICVRQPVMLSYDPQATAQLYTSATGIDFTPEELHNAGERAWNTLKAANVREGFTRKDDRFPDKFLEPLKAGDEEIKLMNYNRTKELTRDDVEKMFDDYYDERGWDTEKGIPTKQKLEDLDLKDVAADLEKRGLL